jgi:16S rRNA (guanine966-N2)-methyltransferase
VLRILGGTAKGVALKVPDSARPSPVRLRKALFDYLRFRYPLRGTRGRFLDLYAGSGAIGLEAASEGFEAVLVEKDTQAVGYLKQNAAKARLEVSIQGMSVERYLAQNRHQFTVAFMAPPYPHDLLQDFSRLLEAKPVGEGGLLILQHPTELSLPTGERRVYGYNTLTLLEA